MNWKLDRVKDVNEYIQIRVWTFWTGLHTQCLIKWRIIAFFQHSLSSGCQSQDWWELQGISSDNYTVYLWQWYHIYKYLLLRNLNLWIKAIYNSSLLTIYSHSKSKTTPEPFFPVNPENTTNPGRKGNTLSDRWKCPVKYEMSFIQSK